MPTVSPLRVGIIQENGIKLRHDFMLSAEESLQLEEAMSGTYTADGLYKLPMSQFVEVWVRRDGLASDVIKQFSSDPVGPPSHP